MRIQKIRSLSWIFARLTLRLSTASCWRRTTFSRASRDRSASSALISASSGVIQPIDTILTRDRDSSRLDPAFQLQTGLASANHGSGGRG